MKEFNKKHILSIDDTEEMLIELCDFDDEVILKKLTGNDLRTIATKVYGDHLRSGHNKQSLLNTIRQYRRSISRRDAFNR